MVGWELLSGQRRETESLGLQQLLGVVLTLLVITAPVTVIDIASASQSGDLTVTVEDRHGDTVSGAEVVLYDSNWNKIDTKETDSWGEVTWSGKSGEYHVEVYNDNEFWGGATPTAPDSVTVERLEPYETEISLTEETSDGTYNVGETVNIGPEVLNPGDYTDNVRVEILVDTDDDNSAEETVTRGPLSVSSEGKKWYGYDFVPESGGEHNVRVKVETEFGGDWALTDDTGWTESFDVKEETEEYELSADAEFGGGLRIYPPGLSTQSGHTDTYEEGTEVELTADPDSDYTFTGWEGDVSDWDADEETITVTMDEAKSLTATFQEETAEYELSADAEFGGSLRIYPPGVSTSSHVETYEEDAEVELTAASESGYTFTGWEGDVSDWNADEETITVTMDEAKSLTATFQEETAEYELSADAEFGGSLRIYPPGISTSSHADSYEEGTEVELTAAPESGYTFTGWEGDVSDWNADEETITVTMDEAKSLTATFQEETAEYELSADAESGGDLRIYPPGVSTSNHIETYEEGAEVELTADPDSGHTFTGWEGNVPDWKADDETITVTIDEATSLTATFQEDTAKYELSADVESGGSLSISPPGVNTATDYTDTYEEDAEVELTATPESDHIFTGWEGDVSDWNADEETITVTMDEAKSLTATFQAQSADYELSVDSESGGSLEITPPGLSVNSHVENYKDGTEVQLTADSDSGYTFTGWEGDVSDWNADEETITVTIDEAKSLTATFQAQSADYELSVDSESGGGLEITPPGVSTNSFTESYEEGAAVDLTATPEPGHTFTGWDGDVSGADADDRTITVTIDQATSLTATFQEETAKYELSTDAESGGGLEIYPPGATTATGYANTYAAGTEIELAANAGSGYTFAGWEGDVSAWKSDEKTITVTMDEAKSLTATFEKSEGQPDQFASVAGEVSNGASGVKITIAGQSVETGSDGEFRFSSRFAPGEYLVEHTHDGDTFDEEITLERGQNNIELTIPESMGRRVAITRLKDILIGGDLTEEEQERVEKVSKVLTPDVNGFVFGDLGQKYPEAIDDTGSVPYFVGWMTGVMTPGVDTITDTRDCAVWVEGGTVQAAADTVDCGGAVINAAGTLTAWTGIGAGVATAEEVTDVSAVTAKFLSKNPEKVSEVGTKLKEVAGGETAQKVIKYLDGVGSGTKKKLRKTIKRSSVPDTSISRASNQLERKLWEPLSEKDIAWSVANKNSDKSALWLISTQKWTTKPGKVHKTNGLRKIVSRHFHPKHTVDVGTKPASKATVKSGTTIWPKQLSQDEILDLIKRAASEGKPVESGGAMKIRKTVDASKNGGVEQVVVVYAKETGHIITAYPKGPGVKEAADVCKRYAC